MTRPRRILLFALAAILAVPAAWDLYTQREPCYQSKRLSQWLEDVYAEEGFSPSSPQPATQAVRAIGKRGIPTLLHLLQSKDTWVEGKWMDLIKKYPVPLIHYHYVPAQYLQWHGAEGFGILGPDAAEALPALVRICHDPELMVYVGQAMVAVSPDATNLVRQLQDSRPAVRRQAAAALGAIQRESEPALPALCKSAQVDSDWEVRKMSIQAIGRFRDVATRNIPVLRQMLSSTNPADIRLRPYLTNTLSLIESHLL